MTKKETLLNTWDSIYDTNGWYPLLLSALADLAVESASWRPDKEGMHSVWELANHLLFYKERFLSRLQGQHFERQVANNDETFLTEDGETWNQTLNKLEQVHQQIRLELERLDDQEMAVLRPTEPISKQVWDLVLHDAYHTGQIIDLRKLNGTWPAKTQY